jgi:hypothetical protein
MLLVTSRDSLVICVDGVEGGTSSEHPTEVEQAVSRVFDSLDEVPPQYANPEFVEGCPPPRLSFGELINVEDATDMSAGAEGIESDSEASPYRVHVYILGREAYKSTFADAPYAIGTQQWLCHYDTCEGVTPAIYVPDPPASQALEDSLIRSLSLYKPPPEPTKDWQACETDPSIWYCERYGDWQTDQAALTPEP